ncbi:MAG0480 family ComEC-like protein [Metamycoplasma buccale]|uniref:MAG0480 family ComEC-like protein n=1 Tax=Metamycoplasma buccale TaxID=55602 RepID=UPI00398E6EBC
MKWNWKDTWHRFKNYCVFKTKIGYLNSIFSSIITALIIFISLFSNISKTILLVLIPILTINIFNWKYFLITTLFILLILISYFIYQKYIFSNIGNINETLKITKVYKNTTIVSKNGINYLIKKNIENVNSFIEIEGNVKRIENITFFNLNQNVFLEIQNIKVKQVYVFNTFIQKYISSKRENIQNYLNLLIFSTKTKNNESIYEELKNLNIIHYFVVSGFHFGLIYFSTIFILKKVKLKEEWAELIGLMPLILYLHLLNFQLSSLRAFLFILLTYINKKILNKYFSNIDLLSLTLLMIIIFQPYCIYNYSVIFSFGITLILLISNNLFKKIKNKYLKVLLIWFTVYISSSLMSLTINEKISIFGFAYQMLFMPIIPIYYFLSIFFIWWNGLLDLIFSFFNNFLDLIKDSNYYLLLPNKIFYFPFVFHLLLIYINIWMNNNNYFNFSLKVHKIQIH